MKSQKIALAHYQQLTQLIDFADKNLQELKQLYKSAPAQAILRNSIASLHEARQEAEMLWLASFQEELITTPPPPPPPPRVFAIEESTLRTQHNRGTRCSSVVMRQSVY